MDKITYLIESWNKKKRRYERIISAGTKRSASDEDKQKMRDAVKDMEERNKRAEKRINDTKKEEERWGYAKKAIRPIQATATALTFPALKKLKVKNSAVRGLATTAAGFGLKRAADKATEFVDGKISEKGKHVKRVQRTIDDKKDLIKRTGIGSSQSYPMKKKQKQQPQQQSEKKSKKQEQQQQQSEKKSKRQWPKNNPYNGLS